MIRYLNMILKYDTISPYETCVNFPGCCSKVIYDRSESPYILGHMDGGGEPVEHGRAPRVSSQKGGDTALARYEFVGEYGEAWRLVAVLLADPDGASGSRVARELERAPEWRPEPAIESTPTVFSGFCCVLAFDTRFAASCCASSRVGM